MTSLLASSNRLARTGLVAARCTFGPFKLLCFTPDLHFFQEPVHLNQSTLAHCYIGSLLCLGEFMKADGYDIHDQFTFLSSGRVIDGHCGHFTI
jgi:hypothetical protein